MTEVNNKFADYMTNFNLDLNDCGRSLDSLISAANIPADNRIMEVNLSPPAAATPCQLPR